MISASFTDGEHELVCFRVRASISKKAPQRRATPRGEASSKGCFPHSRWVRGCACGRNRQVSDWVVVVHNMAACLGRGFARIEAVGKPALSWGLGLGALSHIASPETLLSHRYRAQVLVDPDCPNSHRNYKHLNFTKLHQKPQPSCVRAKRSLLQPRKNTCIRRSWERGFPCLGIG